MTAQPIRDDPRTLTILMAEDDEDDRILVEEAIAESGAQIDLRCVSDGDELFRYLHGRGSYATPGRSPQPDVILLDLNMPRMDGREALFRLKASSATKSIPVVVFTTSRAARDVRRTYELGASGYLVKPSSFDDMVETVVGLERYWGGLVVLPPEGTQGEPRPSDTATSSAHGRPARLAPSCEGAGERVS